MSPACSEHLLRKLCVKAADVKTLPFIGSSFCSCSLYVFWGICTLISGRLTVFQCLRRAMELHSVQRAALIYWSQITLIWVCLCGVTCTDRSSLDVLLSQRFSSHFSLKWLHNILAVPKDKKLYDTKWQYLHLQFGPQYCSSTTKGYKVQCSWKNISADCKI